MGDPDIIRAYDGFLSVDSARVLRAKKLIEASPILKVGEGYIEVAYVGRDSSHFVIAVLKRLAEAISDASGEVTCTFQNEGEDPRFEFYSICEGKLFIQEGAIMRSPAKSVL